MTTLCVDDLAGTPCTGEGCRHPEHAVGGPDEVDLVREELRRMREALRRCVDTGTALRVHQTPVLDRDGRDCGSVYHVTGYSFEPHLAALSAAQEALGG